MGRYLGWAMTEPKYDSGVSSAPSRLESSQAKSASRESNKSHKVCVYASCYRVPDSRLKALTTVEVLSCGSRCTLSWSEPEGTAMQPTL